MRTLYFLILFISTSFFLIASCILFTRKQKDSSRLILSFIMLINSIIYIIRMINDSTNPLIGEEIDKAFILTYILITLLYPIYFFHIIYPKYSPLISNHKIIIPFLFTSVIQPNNNTISIIIVTIVIFTSLSPFLFYYCSSEIKPIYRNNKKLIPIYFYLFIIKVISFILFIIICNIYTKSILCLIELLSSIYIVYLELYCRHIGVKKYKFFVENKILSNSNKKNNDIIIEPKIKDIKIISYRSLLFNKLEEHLYQTQGWSDSNLSIQLLAKELNTNRNTLLQAIKENGYINYSYYINNIRIKNFIHLIESNEIDNYKDAFFEVGFHSRSTALRNFKIFTGKTPSEYFEGEKQPS